MITDLVYFGTIDAAGELRQPERAYQLHYHHGAAWEAVSPQSHRGLRLRSERPERLLTDLLALVAIDGLGMEPENPAMTEGFYVLEAADEPESNRLAAFTSGQGGRYLGFCWTQGVSAFHLPELEGLRVEGGLEILIWKRDDWNFNGRPVLQLPPQVPGDIK